MQKTQKPLSELSKIFTPLPQVLINVNVKSKKELNKIPEVTSAIKKIEDKLGESGRVLVRYSGTEPKARVMIEGEDEKQIKKFAREIADTIKKILG